MGEIIQISAALDPTSGPSEARRALFETIGDRLRAEADPIRRRMGTVMKSFGTGSVRRWRRAGTRRVTTSIWSVGFRQPKGHERRIHGHRHAGVRIVQEGPTLLLALDGHLAHPEPFEADDLRRYGKAQPPGRQLESIHRRKVMRKARSKKKRGHLLAELERRYLASS